MSMQIYFPEFEDKKVHSTIEGIFLCLCFKKQAKGCVLWGYMLAMP